MSGEHLSRRKLLVGAGALTLTAAGGVRTTEAAEIQKGMTWEQAVAAFQDDISRGAVEQSASIARVAARRAFVFNARKGLVASVPPDPKSERSALTEVHTAFPSLERIGIFHQHQQSAIAFGARRYGDSLKEADVIDRKGSIIRRGRELIHKPHSSPFSIDDIEHSALDEQYGSITQTPESQYSIVHGVFDPLGLWYYEMVGQKHLAKLTEQQRSVYERSIQEAETVARMLEPLKVQFLSVLTRILSGKLPGHHRIDIAPQAPHDFAINMTLTVLGKLYNRGIDPTTFNEVRSVLRNHPTLIEQLHIYFSEQKQRLERMDTALLSLRFQSARDGFADPKLIAAFSERAFEAHGVLSRFISYADIHLEQPLSGVYRD